MSETSISAGAPTGVGGVPAPPVVYLPVTLDESGEVADCRMIELADGRVALLAAARTAARSGWEGSTADGYQAFTRPVVRATDQHVQRIGRAAASDSWDAVAPW